MVNITKGMFMNLIYKVKDRLRMHLVTILMKVAGMKINPRDKVSNSSKINLNMRANLRMENGMERVN